MNYRDVDSGRTPLMNAVASNRMDVAKMLVEEGS